jgi:DNA-binding response OmpR family regulator
MLPTSNGFDILRRIRATPRMQSLPVLALTAKGQEADRSRMMELGVDDFVTKPFSNRDLMARVGRLLDAAVQHRIGQTDESA